ncbi:tRNA (adenosine(37)-N6)-dimethylallyltransferase MiaA [Pedobacter sp. AW31-3R]|uniref:tRNA (adenosine(37)-N6)-dimethylallyltransferase MiaA n=1 Tax=Pedobacter sp. AW31-3R TaxID=3445781 RepID=UPI003F9FE99A
MDTHPLLVILGPTASGKTKLAVRMADHLNTEIISADSRQVFKGMDIGTGKDLQEYRLEERTVPHHLINIREAGDNYNVNEFKDGFYEVFEQLTAMHKLPVLCGGTGMYIHSILQHQPFTAIPVNMELRAGLPGKDILALRRILAKYPTSNTSHADLSSAKRIVRAIEIADYLSRHTFVETKRAPITPLVIGLRSDVPSRRERILQRLIERFDQGLIEEVEALLTQGIAAEMLTFYGLEYKFITAYLHKEHTLQELKEKLYIAICQFSKRQMTFFRKMEKDGIKIHWLEVGEDPENHQKDILKLFPGYLPSYQL